MKTTLTASLLVTVFLSMAGCSSTRTKIDSGPIAARTFSFMNTAGKPEPVFAENGQEIHALVQNTIAQSLARRQVSRVEQGGDVTVAYLIITGNNAVTSSINDYFGYSEDATRLTDIAHAKYTSNKNRNYFEAGTLLIDIVDPKSWKVLKRGYATRVLLHNLSPDARAARVSEVVEEILAGVRFQQ